MKHNTINLVKFKTLSRLLGMRMYETVGVLESLWIFTLHNARDGNLSRFSALELAAWIDFDGDPDALIEALVQTGWLDRSEAGELWIHDWQEHAPNWLKGVAARQPGPPPSTEPSAAPSPPPSSEPSAAPGVEPAPLPPNQTKPNPTKQNHRHPQTPSGQDGGGGGLLDTWDRIEQQLAELKVIRIAPALAAAKKHKLTPHDVATIVRVYDEHPGRWGPAALSWRIENGVAAQSPAEGWPKPTGIDGHATANAARANAAKAARIIKAGRKAKRTDEQIKAELDKAGLTWPA